MSNTNFGVALLGFGTVGSGVYQLLLNEAQAIERKYGFHFEVRKILVRNPSRDRSTPLPRELLAKDIHDIVADPKIDVVIEVMGGESPAKEYIFDALRAGKHVITANKKLCGFAGDKLVERARTHQRYFGFAGAVTGFHQLCPSIASSVMIRGLAGVFNGTSNYVLTCMEDGLSFDDAILSAQQKGYAEADPSEDIDGIDTRNKLVIATKLAFGVFLDRHQIVPAGIRDIRQIDLQFARELGFMIKLLGTSQLIDDDKIASSVGPAFIPLKNPLASARGVLNGIQVYDALRGTQGMTASGAGSEPTAMAIFSDLVSMAKGDQILWPLASRVGRNLKLVKSQPAAPHYIRLFARNQPGVLAKITKIFAKANINITNMKQRDLDSSQVLPIQIMVAQTEERDLKHAVRELQILSDVESSPLVIRVDGVASEHFSGVSNEESLVACP